MPLPDGDGVWPPLDVAPYLNQAALAAAWWSGDTSQLAVAANGTWTTVPQAGTPQGRRRFWQRRGSSDATRVTNPLHAPLAADIAGVSADLLFGDTPDLTITGTEATDAAQAQLELLVDDLGLANRLLEGAELAAAVGGAYLRPVWDTDVADHPLLQIVGHDHAIPDFRYGRLVAVTLWEDVYRVGGEVWRHLERHEPGRILHGLYAGTTSTLGSQISLGMHPSTADLEPEIVLGGLLQGRLLPDYIPNTLPNRSLPQLPIGRPDIAGADPFLDALDEAWSSWMRDLRLGQARIIVPDEYLTPAGAKPGSGKTLDIDQEIFTGLNMADAADFTITPNQFALRVTEHADTCMALTEQIISAAGYSPQTFGLHIEGRAESGTALRLRETKTTRTQARKQRYWTPAIARSMESLMLIGAEIFHTPAPAGPISITWPELDQDPSEKASWIQLLRTAQAISIQTAVRLAQPDLSEDDIETEVTRILAETGAAPHPDPAPGLDLA